jgi:hypothetical protein
MAIRECRPCTSDYSVLSLRSYFAKGMARQQVGNLHAVATIV